MIEEGIEAVLDGRSIGQDHVLKRYPLHVDDVVEVIRFLLERREIAGVVHAGTQYGVTRYEWALLIGRQLGARTGHVRSALVDVSRKAPRPPDARLSVERLRELGGPVPRDCDKVLPEVLERSRGWIGEHYPSHNKVVHPAVA